MGDGAGDVDGRDNGAFGDVNRSSGDVGPRPLSRVAATLSGEEHEVGGVVEEVPAPQPTRLVEQAEEPLESAALDPSRRLRLGSGQEIERRPNTDECDAVQLWGYRRIHPEFLFRHARVQPIRWSRRSSGCARAWPLPPQGSASRNGGDSRRRCSLPAQIPRLER